jgi:threonine synthase
VYLANSMNSLRIEGQKTISVEIVQQFDWQVPDLIIIPGGNLGNVSALGAGFDLMLGLGLISKRPRIVVAQAEAANPLYRAYKDQWRFDPITAGATRASAIRIGNPVSIRKAIHTLQQYDGIVEQASEEELANAAARADRTGLFNCPHTGVALAALEKLVARGEVRKSDRVIVMQTDGQPRAARDEQLPRRVCAIRVRLPGRARTGRRTRPRDRRTRLARPRP